MKNYIVFDLEWNQSAEGKEKLKYYSLSIENKSDAAHYCAKYKLLCVALKIGMEIQKSFDEELL